MKKAVLAALLAVGSIYAYGQSTTTTMVGTVRDLTGAIVTSGRITYTLNAPAGGVIPGTGSFVASTVSCGIDINGHPVSTADGTSPCVITQNLALTPTGTSYTQCIQAQFVSPGSCINMFAVGTSIDISAIVPTPTTGPFSFSGTPGPPGPAGPVGPAGPTGPAGSVANIGTGAIHQLAQYTSTTGLGSSNIMLDSTGNSVNAPGNVAAGSSTPTTIGSTGVIFPDGTVQNTKAASVWGSITGTISSQADLVAQLNATAPNMAAWYVAADCGLRANCTQIYGDTQFVVDATSTSTTTVTCPNNDCNFVAGDVGKVVWATTKGTLAGTLEYTTFVCLQTTIAAVNSAQSITLAATCTASGTANVVLIWGHDDGTALASLDTVAGCSVIHMATASTSIMDSQPFLVHIPSCYNALSGTMGAPGPYWLGDGFGASQTNIILTPNFNWGACQTLTGSSGKVCLGGSARGIANIQIWGTGLTPASNANCANANGKIVLGANATSSVIYGVDIAGICPGQTGLEGVEMDNYDESFDLGGAQQVGQYACVAYSAKQLNMRANDCRNDTFSGGIGLYVKNSASLYNWSSFPIIGALVNGAVLVSEFNTYQNNGTVPGVEVQGSGTFTSHADTISELKIDNPGYVTSTNGSHLAANGITISNAGNFTDIGANYWGTNQPTTASTGVWQGSGGVMFGSCRGVATASQAALGLYGFGQFAAATCTSTTTTAGIPYKSIARAGKASTLACNATVGGISAGSGVVSVLKNGSATALTCTFGTGTSCQDNTHTDTPALGDVYSVAFSTQAAETLANVTCTVLGW